MPTLAGLRRRRQRSHGADGHDGLMYADTTSLPLTVHRTTDPAAYLLRPAIPGVGEISSAPKAFAAEWARLGGGPASVAMEEAIYAADAVTIPSGVAGRLRQATHGDAPLLRVWREELVAEVGVTAVHGDVIGRRIDAGSLFGWEVDGDVVTMAAGPKMLGGTAGHGVSLVRVYGRTDEPRTRRSATQIPTSAATVPAATTHGEVPTYRAANVRRASRRPPVRGPRDASRPTTARAERLGGPWLVMGQ